MRDEEQTLLDLADSVANGTPVNWAEVSRTNRKLDPKLAQLRLVERIRAVHRQGAPIHFPQNQITLDPDRDLPETYPPRRWGPLQIIEKIDEGRCGEVFRAYDPNLQKHVALKLLRQQIGLEDADFLNEARRMARVSHKNVLMVHGVDCHADRCGLWAEFIDGRSLEKVIEMNGSMSADEASRIGVDLCRALAALHRIHLVHGDVKTTNVMRENGGRTVLMDFSSARDLEPGQHRDYLSTGTPLYMAPELLKGVDASVSSDIYALGVVLYRLVTAQFPVNANSFEELCEKHRLGDRVPLRTARPDLPPDFVRTVEKAMDPDPARRFTSAAELERALLGVRQPIPPWHRVVLAVGAPLLIAVVAFLAWWVPQLLNPFEVEAELYRQQEGAVAQQLTDGAPVELGDALYLKIRGTRPMHVYAFNTDDTGQTWLLFPLEALDRKNPLEANVSHELPGDQAWEVTTRGGTETFLVIASTRVIQKLEQEIETMPQAGETLALQVDPDRVKPILRGLSGLTPRTKDTQTPTVNLSQLAREASAAGARRGGVWLWQIALRNPDST